jgi:hypothetical protein
MSAGEVGGRIDGHSNPEFVRNFAESTEPEGACLDQVLMTSVFYECPDTIRRSI